MNKDLIFNKLILLSFIIGLALNYIFPFTYNGSLVAKSVFTMGNPLLGIFYAVLVFMLVSAVSPKDEANSGKIIIDKPNEILRTILRSVLELLFGIVFLLIVPAIGSMFLYWGTDLPMKYIALVFFAYIGLFIALGKKYYWSHLY